jgi:hypothetical protein
MENNTIMRAAFTIVLNGLRHFLHKDYWKEMQNNFDYWIIVEGVAKPTGSTSWCKELPSGVHKNYLSNDGTTEFLDKIANDKTIVIRPDNRPWQNKDEQVNAAIDRIKQITNSCFLWQVDVDEQWTKVQLEQAENTLKENGGKTGCFYCNYFVGKYQQVFGDWGEGKIEPYRRLWDWKGEKFISHEPPKLEGNNGPGFLINIRFNHYAYYFFEDVKFKELYYSGYENLYERWLKVQDNTGTMHIRELLGPNTWWSNTNTIIKYTDDC